MLSQAASLVKKIKPPWQLLWITARSFPLFIYLLARFLGTFTCYALVNSSSAQPPGTGHLQTPGLFPSFWHASGFPSEYNYAEDITGKKGYKLICQGQGVVKACSRFYACISSLLIKQEIHSETRELSTWINVFWLVNQISVDIIWRTSFHIYKTIHNI